MDYIKPIIKRKPDILLIHSDTNDLTNNVNTVKTMRDLVKCVRNQDRNEEIQVGFSSIISRKEKELEKEINETNTKLRKYCEGKVFFFVDNSNINESCLSNSKFHLNRKGSKRLSSKVKKSLCQVWCSQTYTRNIDVTNNTLIKNNEIAKVLFNFRRNNSSDVIFDYLNITTRNKFDNLRHIITETDVLSIIETKIDASFPSAQFALKVTIHHID